MLMSIIYLVLFGYIETCLHLIYVLRVIQSDIICFDNRENARAHARGQSTESIERIQSDWALDLLGLVL